MRKLDKRIQKVTDIKTPFSEDFEELSNYIGFNVYGADDVNHFHNLEACFFGALKHVSDDANYSFVIDSGRPGDTMPFRYMILEKDLEPKEKKEKQYRPYTFMEFTDIFTVGQPIKFRQKGKVGCERYLILNGYMHEQYNNQTVTYIYIGAGGYTLQELFEEYEWQKHYTEDFKPFGVEVEE